MPVLHIGGILHIGGHPSLRRGIVP